MPSSEAVYGGSLGSRYRLHLDVTVVTSDHANNRTKVRMNAYMKTVSSTNAWNYNSTYANYQSNGNLFNTSVNGYGTGGGTYGPGSNWNFALVNKEFWIYHNSNGTKTANFYAYHNASNAPYVQEAATSFNYALPALKSTATVGTYNASNVQPTQASVSGIVSSSGNATITQRGIYYSTSDTTPDSNDSRKTVSGTTGTFSTTLTGLTPNTKYYYRAYAINSQGTGYGAVKSFTTSVTPIASVSYISSSVYADGSLKRDTGSGWSALGTSDLWFKTYSEQGATTVPHTSDDPSTIVENAIDYGVANGSPIVYDSNTLEQTSSTVTYTFVSQTLYEVIQTTLGLAPDNWYWYVDVATNYLHFHEKPSTADHIFTLGKDVIEAKIAKHADNIINTIFFTGGDDGGGILYKKYQDATSIGEYGIRDEKHIDQRVTDTATADVIAQRILNSKSQPEIRLELTVLDSNNETGGYDIESIKVGDVIALKNVKVATTIPLDINEQLLQIVRLEYSPDRARIQCSTLPPEVSKRIEDIRRNLDDSITISNPDTPT